MSSLYALLGSTQEKTERSKTFNVYRKGICVETVFFSPECSADYVRKSLIEHDGYANDIVVRERR